MTAAPTHRATASVLERTVSSRGRRTFAALAVVPILAFALAACGSADAPGVASAGNGSPSATGEDTPSLTPEEMSVKFTSCMRENGVDMPDPGEGGDLSTGGGVDVIGSTVVGSGGMLATDEALAACKQYMPNGGEVTEMAPEDVEAMRLYATCMRENGVDMPDPDPASGGMAIPLGSSDDAVLAAANEACADTMPFGGLSVGSVGSVGSGS